MLYTALVLCILPLLAHSRSGFRQKIDRRHEVRQRQHERTLAQEQHHREKRWADWRYYNNKTAPYLVESLPYVNYSVGEMYAGNIPIDYSDPNATLFFVWQAKVGGNPVDEVTIWLNGGPGCSSIDGFFQENGLFTWVSGTYLPTINPYSWVNETNMLWVDQPAPVGYSTGKGNYQNETESAADFVKWLKNFQTTFGIKNYKIYVTGESYAGRYVPYISYEILQQNDTEYFNLQGAMALDPCIGNFVATQEEFVAAPFVAAYNNILGLNDTFVAELQQSHEECGYADYLEKYLVFPASGVQPADIFNVTTSNATCDVFDAADTALLQVNPCFNIYDVTQGCPLLYDVLGFPTQLFDNQTQLYFDRQDVKKALHAPLDRNWMVCTDNPFNYTGVTPELGEGDNSPDPAQFVLPKVIEATNRVLIGNGDLDMIIITNGTLLAIQNMTWNGKLGFQSAPSNLTYVSQVDLVYTDIFDEQGYEGVDVAQGIVGKNHFERGLMWVETYQSGHMQPEDQPRASLLYLQWLLGRIDSIPGAPPTPTSTNGTATASASTSAKASVISGGSGNSTHPRRERRYPPAF